MYLYSLVASVWLLGSAVAVSEIVDIGSNRYQGQALPNGISQWLGIRYAAPPLGSLRFMPPQDPPRTGKIEMATKHGLSCLATGRDPKDKATSEDCLFLDVQAPTNTTGKAPLPVFLYIQGGGFNLNSNPNTNASGLIMASGNNIVVVSLNYRVGPYGFITDGTNITPNIGLRDQRKAMEWVKNHISRFGGDPNHIVLGGSSAGGASVTMHLMANNGTDQKLFHAAIAQSPSFASTLTVKQSQYQYRQFATRLGCAGKSHLDCLRKKTAEQLQEENFAIPLPGGASPPNYMWLPVIDGEFISDYAHQTFRDGKFIKVPTIYGDDSNGGTKFAPKKTATQAESNQYILDQYPSLTLEMLGELNELYDNPNKTCPGKGCWWRQASNVYGEARYMCPGFFVLSQVEARGVPNAYAYRWNVEDPQQMASGLGVPHTVELAALWGADYVPDPPASYKTGGVNEKASATMQSYWINFITSFDPNKPKTNKTALAPANKWQRWSDASQQRLAFVTGGKAKMEPIDAGLKQRCSFWDRNANQLGM